jgi:hypothetical protein
VTPLLIHWVISHAFGSALAELLGTFFLTLAALTVAAPITPFAVRLTLLVFVYAAGSLHDLQTTGAAIPAALPEPFAEADEQAAEALLPG